jgi:hypothetical protein
LATLPLLCDGILVTGCRRDFLSRDIVTAFLSQDVVTAFLSRDVVVTYFAVLTLAASACSQFRLVSTFYLSHGLRRSFEHPPWLVWAPSVGGVGTLRGWCGHPLSNSSVHKHCHLLQAENATGRAANQRIAFPWLPE